MTEQVDLQQDTALPSEVQIAVVIPAYDVGPQIGAVLGGLPAYVRHVIVVDDGSHDRTSQTVARHAESDARVILLSHDRNRGVGAAMVTGFRKALDLDVQVVVKVDGDGQMAPDKIGDLIEPLLASQADFSKGNRFTDSRFLSQMPLARRVGNIGLSFLAKAATGYWDCFDPTNGFFAIRAELLRQIPLEKIDRSFFFEISLLAQLYLAKAAIRDVSIPARYGTEQSHLSIWRTLIEFPPKLLGVFLRRVVLRYFLYDFSIVSVYIAAGLPLLLFGLVFGTYNWIWYSQRGVPAPTGTVMLATLPVILGFQLILSAIGEDLHSVPGAPICDPI